MLKTRPRHFGIILHHH